MTRFNKTLLAAALGVAMAPVAQTAHAEVSANIGVTINYVWRGVTQTDDNAAVSGGIDWGHDSGFYLGTWASNVDFGPGAGEVEWDIYGGYGGSVGDFGYDVGLAHYMYPDTDDADFTELALSGSFKWFTVGLNYTVSSDIDDAAGSAEAFIEDDIYYYASAGFEVAPTWSLGLTIGSYQFDDDGEAGADFDYTHWQADIGKSAGDFGDFTFSLGKVDDDNNFTADDDLKVFVSWSKSF